MVPDQSPIVLLRNIQNNLQTSDGDKRLGEGVRDRTESDPVPCASLQTKKG